jgi:hypothetical protein
MDLYARNKFLVRIIVILILLNIFSVGFMWWQRKENCEKRPPKRDIAQITSELKDKLKMNDDQFRKLQQIREDFFKKEEALRTIIKLERDSMNMQMFQENTDTLMVRKIARHVADNEYCMESYRIEQAGQLKKLCNADQLKKLHEMAIEIRDYFQPEKKPKAK